MRWVERGLLAYAFLLPLRRLFFLPALGSRLQLTELCFLLVAPPALYVLRGTLRPGRGLLLTGLLAYLLVLSLATLLGPPPPDWTELLGRYYLLAVLLLFTAYVRHTGGGGQHRVLRAWTLGLYVMGGLAYLGYGLALAGIATPLVSYYPDYPYFGTLYRATGTAGGATALVALSLLPFTYAYRQWRLGGALPGLLPFLLPLFLLTFSKEVLLVGIACLLVEPTLILRRVLRASLLVTLSLTYWLSTHLMVQPIPDKAADRGQRAGLQFRPGAGADRSLPPGGDLLYLPEAGRALRGGRASAARGGGRRLSPPAAGAETAGHLSDTPSGLYSPFHLVRYPGRDGAAGAGGGEYLRLRTGTVATRQRTTAWCVGGGSLFARFFRRSAGR